MDFLKILSTQDYILTWVILITIAVYSFLWLNRLYKTIFWVFLWFLLFALLNFAYISFETNNLEFLWWLKDFMITNKTNLLNFTFYTIPVLAILISFNNRFHFTRETSNKAFKLFRIIVFSPFLVIFYTSIITCTLQNKFIFTFDKEFITSLQTSVFWNLITKFSWKSVIFDFIVNNQFILSLIWFIFVLYILTIWGFVRKLMLLLKEKFTPLSRPKKAEIDNLLSKATSNLVNK